MTPGFHNTSATSYHSDCCSRPSLSASIAHRLLSASPYHAWLAHPKLGGVRREPTREMERGTIIHGIVLGQPDELVVIQAADYRTKAAQQQRDDARANGMTPILASEYDGIVTAAYAIGDALRAEGIELSGQSEAVAVWEEQTASGPILCRGMMDHVLQERALIYDLKTCSSAHPKAIQRSIIDHGYDVQWAAYTSAFRKLRPDLAGREQFVWLFVEELPEGSPQRVALTVAKPSGLMRELGEWKWRRLRTLSTWSWACWA